MDTDGRVEGEVAPATKASGDDREGVDGHKSDDDFGDDDTRSGRANAERSGEDMDVETRVVAPAKEPVPKKVVDRTKTCPFLLRVFPKENEFNRLDEFARARLPQNELQIYTWESETLRTLTQLIKSQLTAFRAKETQFYFGVASPDARGNYSMRTLGMTQGGRKGNDDTLSLGDLNFRIGDYICVKVVVARDQPVSGRGDRDAHRDGRSQVGPRDRGRDYDRGRDRDRERDRRVRR